MAFQPCPGVASLVATYSIPDGDLAENIFHVLTSGTWGGAELTNLCAAYVAWEATTFGSNSPKGLRRTTTSLISLVARDLTTVTGAEVVYTTGLPIVGIDTGNDNPAGITMAVKLGTGIPGRSYRGRVFFIGLGTNSLSTSSKNIITSSTGISLVNIYVGLKNAIKAANANWDLSVLSRQTNNAVRADGIATPVSSVSLTDGFIDYQRRRAPGHSRHH